MRRSTLARMIGGCLLAAAAPAAAPAQGPGGGPERARGPSGAGDLVTRMMAFDADKDGKLTEAEVTDRRLLRLFGRADANKDGVVTKEELTALAAKEPAGRGGFPGGPGGFPGGPNVFMMGPPRPGEVLPAMVQQGLKLTAEQKTQLEALQKDVDARLEKILNDEQKAQLKRMRERGPGGFGPPPGGPGGPGGFGPPPGGRGGRPGGGEPPPPGDRPE